MTNREVIRPDGAPPAVGAYSPAIRAGDFVFASGQLGTDPETGEFAGSTTSSAQAEQALANLAAILDAAGQRARSPREGDGVPRRISRTGRP